MKFFRCLSAVLLLAIVLSTSSFTILADGDIDSPNNIVVKNQQLENSVLKLEVSEKGELKLTDKKSGQTFSSRNSFAKNDEYSLSSYRLKMDAEVEIDYYNIHDALISNQSAVAYSSEADISVKKEKGVIVVKYYFTSYKIGFNVEYRLFDDSFEAVIDIKSIKEGKDYGLNKISLLPGFFSGNGDDNGYIFVPDGSGALINYNNNAVNEYSSEVYGSDISIQERLKRSKSETVRMPVFGAVNDGLGMFAIITSGDAAAKISAGTKNNDNWYNYVYSTLNVRSTYEKMMFSADKTNRSRSTAYSKNLLTSDFDEYSVRYYVFSENVGYSQMAKIYRKYLIEEKKLKSNVNEPKLNIELIGAIDIKANFLGFTYYKNKPLTTYSEAVNIIKKLKKAGIENIAIRYSGWSNNGITNDSVMEKTKVMGVLGGKKDFAVLNDFAEKNEVSIDYNIDMLKFYSGSKKYRVSSPFKETLSFSRYLRSVYATDISKRSWYMLSPKYIEDNFVTVDESLKKLGIKNISLYSLSNTLYSDLNGQQPITRTAMQISAQKIFSGCKGSKVSAECANAYIIPYVAKIYSTPCYSSGYNILDKEIPFYQIVIHGLVDMTSESQFISDNRLVNYLKSIETGSQLLYTGIAKPTSEIVDTDYDYLYGTNYLLWIDDAAQKYKEYQPLLKKIYNSVITDHFEMQFNVYKTVYENGIEVIVNYNNNDVTVDGIKIEAYGFCEVNSREN